jgi:tetratricopeptide (TPR) repeat protein
MSGNPGRAIELFKKALELDPTHSETLGEMAMAYAETGQYAQALATFDKVTEDLPYLGGRAYALAMSGDRAGAMRVLAQMEQRSKREYVFPQTFAYPYIAFGDKDRAFEWLERSYADHDLMYLKCMPIFESLRSDPRYHSLLRRMNLE